MMTRMEEQVIRNVILRLRCGTGPSGGTVVSRIVKAAPTGPAKLYLETRVIGALTRLLPESRDPALALKLSQVGDDRDPEPVPPPPPPRRAKLDAGHGRSVITGQTRMSEYPDKS